MNPYKPHLTPAVKDFATRDSFVNFAAKVGIGADNQHSQSTYSFNPISRNRLRVEWCYRGSWLAGVIVDAIAEDMTREWIEVINSDGPDKLEELDQYRMHLDVQNQLCDTIKWARLYGGACAFILIDGHDNTTPLEMDTDKEVKIEQDQFKGLYAMDRWMIQPHLDRLVKKLGPDLGKPEMYTLLPDSGTGLQKQDVHYTRLLRMEGLKLPYWQRITENYWGQSVLERLWDRMVSFDSTTLGAAQLVYKAHLRTYSVEGLREMVATQPEMLEALITQINFIRRFQTSEGFTMIDKADEMETSTYAFSGLSDIIMQFGMQLSGASQIPLVRLFGQSPAGLSATGESDIRNYYDGIKNKQISELYTGMWKLYRLLYKSKFGSDMPAGTKVKFKPLWQLSEPEKATVGLARTQTVMTALEGNAINRKTAMKELKSIAEVTGQFSNIDDKDIQEAEGDPAPTPEALGLELPPKPVPGEGNAGPGQKPGAKTGANGGGAASVRKAA